MDAINVVPLRLRGYPHKSNSIGLRLSVCMKSYGGTGTPLFPPSPACSTSSSSIKQSHFPSHTILLTELNSTMHVYIYILLLFSTFFSFGLRTKLLPIKKKFDETKLEQVCAPVSTNFSRDKEEKKDMERQGDQKFSLTGDFQDVKLK